MNNQNKKNGLLAVLAIGIMALLLAGTVYAENGENGTLTTKNPFLKGKKIMGEKPILSAKKITAKPIFIKNEKGKEIKEKIQKQFLNMEEVKIGKFKEQVINVRKNILDYNKNNYSREFQGMSITEIVESSQLTKEQQKILLDSYEQMKNSGEKNKQTLLMWSVEDRFIGIGKAWGIETDSGNVGKAMGFNNLSHKPFVFVWGGNFFAGTQGGKIFWGTYDTDEFTMHFQGGETIDGNYMLYD